LYVEGLCSALMIGEELVLLKRRFLGHLVASGLRLRVAISAPRVSVWFTAEE